MKTPITTLSIFLSPFLLTSCFFTNLWAAEYKLPEDVLYTLTGHERDITSIAFSPDGHTLASGSEDKSIKL
jgi:WD40 repeat protein